MGGSAGLTGNSQTADTCDAESVYEEARQKCKDSEVIFQNVHKVGNSDSLFYTPVTFGGLLKMGGMLDSGSMACSMNEAAEVTLRESGLISDQDVIKVDVTLVGCGGLRVKPKYALNVEMEVYGCRMIVPILVVQGQLDDLILGTNVIKHILHQSKRCEPYWNTVFSNCSKTNLETENFLSMLSGLTPWKDSDVPDKVGTVRCNSAVSLEPGREYLVWGKLPKNINVSPGSTVMTEPSSSRSAPRGILVARLVTPLWGDRWVPLKLINMSEQPVHLRRNAKLADVYSCVALEDFDASALQETTLASSHQSAMSPQVTPTSMTEKLKLVGLGDVDIESCETSGQCKERMADLVLQYEDVFSRHHLDCGEAKNFVHRIRLSDNRPFRLPYRRVPPSQYQKLRQVLTEMEERDIIRKSTSEYASPLVLVWKKNGDLRICNDFRWLNKRTLKDAHPLPHQADCLAALGGNSLFSTMDLTSGFYNMTLHEDDRKYSAFTTPMGLYEYNRLPQGLCNSPASFMRMMTSIFGDQNYLSLLCYLDDLLVFAPDEDTALQRLEMVFERLRGHNLKLAPRKCFFLRKSVKFLGHIIDQNGVSTDPSKVEVIANMRSVDLMDTDGVTPSQRKVRSFLGMINYYQHFVPMYSAVARPLFELLRGAVKKGKGTTKVRRPCRKLSASDWTSREEEAFEKLKSLMLNTVVLAHPDFSRPFLLSTDASLDGIGAVLAQIQDGGTKPRPIAFASKSLSQSQRNYPAHRLEFLALKWSVCDKFSHWLKGHKFTVWTDNNPLTHILTKPKLDCCEQRWVAKLASYDFDIKYVPGRQNIVADALSRLPFVKDNVSDRLLAERYADFLNEAKDVSHASIQGAFRWSTDCKVNGGSGGGASIMSQGTQSLHPLVLAEDAVTAVLQSHVEWDVGPRGRAIEALHHLPQMVSPGLEALPAHSERELRDAQLQDAVLSRVVFYVERHRRPSRRERVGDLILVKRYLSHWEKLVLNNGVLYRVSRDQISGNRRLQFVVPDSLKAEVLRGIHDDAGHQGQFRSLDLARKRFFWLNLGRDVRDHVRGCQRCVVSKTIEPEGRAPLVSVSSSRPLELVCIDFWSAEASHNKSVDVLVITDHFTGWAQAFPCKDQSAKQVARLLWDRYFCVFGFPERIHSDQGANFESQLISELLRVSGVKKTHTTPYHPMGNGSVERFNRTLGGMIRALPPDSKVDWPRRLQTLTFMYNCTAHETTGFAPFYLMFGRTPRLPVDILFRSVLSDPAVTCYDRYVVSLREDVKEAMVIARTRATQEKRRHSQLYNRRVKGSRIEVGDRVLVANKKERGKKKVADRWESTVYTVIDVNHDTHTFKIRDSVSGRERVVHRNLLLVANFLPLEDDAGTSDHVSSTWDVNTAPEDDDGAASGEGDLNAPAVSCVGAHGNRSPNAMGGTADLEVISEPLDPGERTVAWVSQLTESSQSQGDVTDVSSVDSVLPAASALSVEVNFDQTGSSMASQEVNIATSCGEGVQVCSTTPDVVVDVVAPAIAAQSPMVDYSQTGNGSQIRTRLGRLVKPVNRLIQTMSNQVVVRDRFDVKSVCKSLIPSFSN